MFWRDGIVDMGIARLDDVWEVPNLASPFRFMMSQSNAYAGQLPPFDWVVWVEGSHRSYGWSFLTDQILEQSLRGEQWVFELAAEDCLAEIRSRTPSAV